MRHAKQVAFVSTCGIQTVTLSRWIDDLYILSTTPNITSKKKNTRRYVNIPRIWANYGVCIYIIIYIYVYPDHSSI